MIMSPGGHKGMVWSEVAYFGWGWIGVWENWVAESVGGGGIVLDSERLGTD